MMRVTSMLVLVMMAGCDGMNSTNAGQEHELPAPGSMTPATRRPQNSDSSDYSSVSTSNRLTLNRLTLNRLTLNRLTLNRLSLHRISDDELVLDSTISQGLEDTEAGRELLEYLSRCALSAGTTLVATDTSGVQHDFPGLLGLAPEWESRALTESEQRLLSSCLLAHVNAYGVPVTLSLRSSAYLNASADEMSDYAIYEGTFFGQLFGDVNLPMAMYACQGDDSDLALALSATRSLRVCTDENPGCDFTVVGRCRDVCQVYDPGYGWSDCTVQAPDGTVEHYHETLSAFLYTDDPDEANGHCEAGESCFLRTRSGQAALHQCRDAHLCSSMCDQDSECIVNAGGSGHLTAWARPQSRVQIECAGTDRCKVDCQSGASCDIECQDAADCSRIRCASGASCLLHCSASDDGSGGQASSADTCGFESCLAGEMTCASGIKVCGQPCP